MKIGEAILSRAWGLPLEVLQAEVAAMDAKLAAAPRVK